MTYVEALQDLRVDYAIKTGRIDGEIEESVIEFLEEKMREAAKKIDIPEYGYIVIDNMYATFARKIEAYKEAEKCCELEDVYELIDSGLLKRYAMDKSRCAVYYVPEKAGLGDMKRLLKQTERKLSDAKEEYERRLRVRQGTGEMKESVYLLNKRVRMQQQTINSMEVLG